MQLTCSISCDVFFLGSVESVWRVVDQFWRMSEYELYFQYAFRYAGASTRGALSMQHATCSTYSTKRAYACRAGSSQPSPSVRFWTQFGSTDIRSVCVLIGPACAVFAAVARKRTLSHSLTVASHSLI
jgi:hypothetical protein